MTFDTTGATQAVRDLLRSFGMDPSAPELADTPARVAEFWAERLAGYQSDPA